LLLTTDDKEKQLVLLK